MISPPEAAPTTVSTQIACVRCDQPVPTDRKFCGACGARIWEPCLACGRENPISETFCGQCGVNIAERVQQTISAINEQLQRAADEEANGNLLEAISILEQVPSCDHSAVAGLIDCAVQRRAELREKRAEAIEYSRDALQQAEALAASSKFQAAAKHLQKVPESLRNQPMRDLLAELQETLREMQTLRRAVRDGLRSGSTTDLLPRVERLLELEPENLELHKLGTQLQLRIQREESIVAREAIRQAHTLLAKNEYRQAGKCLAMVSDSARKTDLSRHFNPMMERVWLARQLRIAPFANKTLLAVAKRLVKLQPKDEQTARLAVEIEKRLRTALKDHGATIAQWAEPSGPSQLVAPVELLDLAATFLAAEDDRVTLWRRNPCEFAVAAGLALSGLGESAVDVDLSVRNGSKWINRLSTAMRSKRGRRAWGVDLGTTALRLVQLGREKAKAPISILQAVSVPHRTPLYQVGREDEQDLIIGESIAKCLQEHKLDEGPVVLGLPGKKTLGRFFRVPEFLKAARLHQAIEYEARNQVPLPLDEVVYGYRVWEQRKLEDADSTREDRETPASLGQEIYLVAAKKQHVTLHVQPFVEAGLRPTVVQSECVALTNLAMLTLGDRLQAIGPTQALAIIEIGAESTNVVVVSRESAWFRAVYRGSQVLNRKLAKQLEFSHAEVEQLLRSPEKAEWMFRLNEQLQPALADLTEGVQREVRVYEESHLRDIVGVFGTGGAMRQIGVLRYLQRGE